MFTDISDPDSGAYSASNVFSRINDVIDIINQLPFATGQQTIITELSETVFDSLVGLSTQYSSSSARSSDHMHEHDEHDHEHGHNHHHHLPEGAEGFATIGRNGQRINNGNNGGLSELKWTRSDGKSDGRGATVVTFAFDDGFNVNGISTNEAKSLFVDALETWARYSPLDFVEVKDPGSGDKVDILAQTDNIDGPSKTLAFAYFPTVGDITFDSSENWSRSAFLETALHELGHSLGLDHENDTDAIMNSVLGNRFGNGKAFLFDDDIKGVRSLYGGGRGSVTTLSNDAPSVSPPNETPPQTPEQTPQQPTANLVRNGSFEDVPISRGETAKYSQINGWTTISGKGFQVDRRPDTAGRAADGNAWVELDTLGENSTIGQNIDTVTGQRYNVSVDFSNGGRPESTTSVQIFWEGNQIDTLSGGGRGAWRRFNYTLTGSDRSVSTLAFRAIGQSDNVGGFIDNIVVTAARESLTTEGADGAAWDMNLGAGLGAGIESSADSAAIVANSSSPILNNALVMPSPVAEVIEGALV